MPGQEKTEDFIKFSEITARPYPQTSVVIKFADDTTKDAIVIRDENAIPGAQNIMVKYGDNTTQRFTSADGDNIRIKINEVLAHYRGGRKRKTRRNKKSRKSKKSKSRKMYKKTSRR